MTKSYFEITNRLILFYFPLSHFILFYPLIIYCFHNSAPETPKLNTSRRNQACRAIHTIHNVSPRAQADKQMRESFKDLRDRIETPVLDGFSAIRNRVCLYKYTEATGDFEPQLIPSSHQPLGGRHLDASGRAATLGGRRSCQGNVRTDETRLPGPPSPTHRVSPRELV